MRFEGCATEGVGFTEIVTVLGVPAQPFAEGVTVIVAIITVELVFITVKAGILPVPLAANPMLGVLFVQA